MTDELKAEMIDCERDAITLDIALDKLEAGEETYKANRQERTSIKVVIDGVEMSIGKENCDATILELFEEIVYERQVKKIAQYLISKYPQQECLSREQAKHELQISRLPNTNDFFEFGEISEMIAEGVVTNEKV